MASSFRRQTLHPHIIRITDTEYRVGSHTDRSLEYTVLLYSQGATCTCKGYGYRQRCSHIDEVRAYLAAKLPTDALVVDEADRHIVVDTEGFSYTSDNVVCGCGNDIPATHIASGKCPACVRAATLGHNK